jgi:hypothetical protein
MASPALNKYIFAAEKVEFLRSNASSNRLISPDGKQIIYHAALAVNVAAWDAYINNIIKDFYNATSNPSDHRFNALHMNIKALSIKALDKFNTPNWENTRNIFTQYTGYDPYSDWIWPSKNMAPIHVQERLNQILKVRHSFAHGFAMPSYDWNRTSGSSAESVGGFRFR